MDQGQFFYLHVDCTHKIEHIFSLLVVDIVYMYAFILTFSVFMQYSWSYTW
jgi:hypothetical protein